MAPKAGPLAGTLIAVSERGARRERQYPGVPDRRATRGAFSVKRSDEFDISDCAVTPGGELLVLERRFSWTSGIAMRIRSVPLAAIEPGATVDGAVLIEADMGYQIDNMEGMGVHRARRGREVLTLVSDDNFSLLQRTMLLQFTLSRTADVRAGIIGKWTRHRAGRSVEVEHVGRDSLRRCFFSISRLSSRTRGDELVVLRLHQEGVETAAMIDGLQRIGRNRSFTERPSASDISVTLNRFGRNRRLVLMLEWLTLWPTMRRLPVRSQRRDIAKPSNSAAPSGAGIGGFGGPRTYSDGGPRASSEPETA